MPHAAELTLAKDAPEIEYRCPGQRYAISRAVHLGRLAAFYPGCRQCPYRDDTGTLSTRQVRQLVETRRRAEIPPLFHAEGIGGQLVNQVTPSVVHKLAVAFAALLREQMLTHSDQREPVPTPVRQHRSGGRPCRLVVGGDGRPITGPLVAAAIDGLRYGGCDVIDVGPTTAAGLGFAIDHFGADSGLLVGNPDRQPQYVGVKLWLGPWPILGSEPLAESKTLYEQAVDRPTRRHGQVQRLRGDEPYLAELARSYHALRPLRVVLDSASAPLARFVDTLCATVACRIITCHTEAERLPERIRDEAAHLALRVDGDGESCQLYDEQGRRVSPERLLVLLARHLIQITPDEKPSEPPVVVLENAATSATADRLTEAGLRVVRADSQRNAMAAAMCRHAAPLGGGVSGRFWYAQGTTALPDALRVLTELLVVLSQSDRPFSAVLDREAALD